MDTPIFWKIFSHKMDAQLPNNYIVCIYYICVCICIYLLYNRLVLISLGLDDHNPNPDFNPKKSAPFGSVQNYDASAVNFPYRRYK